MDERGFTLVDLLLVVLIIGILAAIALPAFLGQAQRAHDASAKIDIRDTVAQMELCFTDEYTYAGCPHGDGPIAIGVVAVALDGGSRYTVSKRSDTGTSFTITRLAAGYSRTCTRPAVGGCDALGSW